MKEISPALWIVGLSAVVAITFVIHPSFLSLISLGFSNVQLNDATNTWIISAAHSGIIGDQITWGGGTLKESSGTDTSSNTFKLEETDYKISCDYAKGSANTAVWRYLYWQHMGDVLAATAGPTCRSKAVELYGAGTAGFLAPSTALSSLSGYDCYFFLKYGDYYDAVSQTKDYSVNLTVSSSDGDKASVLLTPFTSFKTFIDSKGVTLGTVTVVGGLDALKSNCNVYAYKWFHQIDTNQDYFIDGTNDAKIAEFHSALFGGQSAMQVKLEYDGYTNNIVKKATLTDGGAFNAALGKYSYIPPSVPVNLLYSLSISANWIKVVRPLGIPILSNVQSSAAQDGSKTSVSFHICNSPTAGASPFTVQLQCAGFPTGYVDVPSLAANACVDSSVSTIANCPTTTITSSCTLSATAAGGTDSKTFSLSCQSQPNPTKCVAGKLYCNDMLTQVQLCNADGIKTNIGQPCKCIIKDDLAQCDGNPCPPGQQLNTTTNQCQTICPTGTSWDGTKCSAGGFGGWIWIVIGAVGLIVIYFVVIKSKGGH